MGAECVCVYVWVHKWWCSTPTTLSGLIDVQLLAWAQLNPAAFPDGLSLPLFVWVSPAVAGACIVTHTLTHTVQSHVLLFTRDWCCCVGSNPLPHCRPPSLPLFCDLPGVPVNTHKRTHTHIQAQMHAGIYMLVIRKTKEVSVRQQNQAAGSCEARVNPRFQGPETKRSLADEIRHELLMSTSPSCHLVHSTVCNLLSNTVFLLLYISSTKFTVLSE